MNTPYAAVCTCTWTTPARSETEAVRLAAFHEARNVRRAYAHDATATSRLDAAFARTPGDNARLVWAC